MRAAVVVLNHDKWERTRECVWSVRESLLASGLEAELVIVDNGSCEEPPPWTAESDVRLVRLPTNVGYGAGNNAGIRAALELGADPIIILNNDTTIPKGAIAALLDAHRSGGRATVLVPEIRFSSDPEVIWQAGGRFDPWLGKAAQWGVGVRADQFEPPSLPVTFASGCVLLVPRGVFDTIGLFDEGYFLYWEDVAWSLRVTAAGIPIEVVRGSIVLHDGGSASRYRSHQAEPFYYYAARNRLWVVRRHLSGVRRLSALARTLEVAARSAGYVVIVDREQRGRKLRAIINGTLDGMRRPLSLPDHGRRP